jgi:hypothetical protein
VKRCIINPPPRHTKSKFTNALFPAWYIGRLPSKKILECSHTASRARDFGRNLRNLVNSPEYRAIFTNLKLSVDVRPAGRRATQQAGGYFAVGKAGAAAGLGGNEALSAARIASSRNDLGIGGQAMRVSRSTGS